MKLSGLIDALVAAGGSVDQVRAVVLAAEAAQEAEAADRRAKAAAKKKRQRSRKSPNVPGTDGDGTGQQGTDGDEGGQGFPSSSFPPHPPNNYTPSPKTHTHTTPEARAISADWEPTPETVEAVIGIGVPRADVPGEVRRFRDRHLGNGATATNWDAKFRGFAEYGLRNAKPPRPPRGGPPPRASPPPADSDDSPRVNTPSGPRSLAFLRTEHEAGRWSKLYGPALGQPGCLIAEPSRRAAE